jgi:hypothetical protein
MVGCAAFALGAREQRGAWQAAAFAVASLGLALLAVWVDVRWKRHLRAAAASP